MQRAEVMIQGPGLGRDAVLCAIHRSGILLSFVRDVTPMPHNGCRPPKLQKPVLSSDCRLQLAYMKPESLVIAGQPYGSEFVPGPCTHRRHTMGVGHA
ncbi:hypothetical protein LWI28_008481 [Acer negundo]|uniref:Uncharacterized protein n=1 Tax=Acer negundo TaxID=4023 RepID=A0AAD5IA24_ACENE|nr:hypothetical protein LWI28_008481 [Acer negundo]